MLFVISSTEIEFTDFILLFELLYRGIKSEEVPSENLNILRNKFLDTVTSSCAKIKSCKIKSNLSSGEAKALRNLTKQKDQIHKPVINNCPSFRQIVVAINTPSYKLAKFLVPILSSLTITAYAVKDSFAFAEEITKTNCNYVMASLDVESLFIKIPSEETIKNCVNDLFFDKSKIDNLSKQDL